MNNADKFKQIFDLYATELWAMSEKDFLAWLNAERDVPDRKVGKWKPFDRTWGRSVWACDACGETVDVPTLNGKPIFDYCPWCGAKMTGDVKDSE